MLFSSRQPCLGCNPKVEQPYTIKQARPKRESITAKRREGDEQQKKHSTIRIQHRVSVAVGSHRRAGSFLSTALLRRHCR
jgi:hypothetical protein